MSDPNGLGGDASQGSQQGDTTGQDGGQKQPDLQQGGTPPDGELVDESKSELTTPTTPTPPPPAPRRQSVQARVLLKCEHGKPNDVVDLSGAAARAAERAGQICTHPDSVAYALKLKR